MEKVKLSIHDALMLEALRAGGLSDGEIVEAAKSGDITKLASIGNEDFDFNDLIEFAKEHGDVLEQAAAHGYEIKFNTMGGTKYLLKVKFGLQANEDYTAEKDHLHGVPLSAADLEWLKGTMSRYWTVALSGETSADGRFLARIAPAGVQ
ncbi:hypothetical protein [Paenibacillus thermotolerans]|uniref:hypothetical protein n=1 Tax=Paenibacillus thermotolerans TaxID=3027807 RepID=UPI002368AB27|nr:MULTISPECIES: hypothetical protein [unclassified Paenibacillus]